MDVYGIVTERIIKELENGIIPWRKPWTGVREGAYSGSTGRPYSLMNQLLLGKPGEYWTKKQIMEKGGSFKEGEQKKGSIVVFWKWKTYEDKKDDGTVKTKTVPLLRYFEVWHIDQLEGIERKYKEAQLKDWDPIEEAERIMNEYSARENLPIVIEKSNRAYYSSALDEVHLPLREQFDDPAEFYATGFHELTHSTGHPNRLDRLEKTAHFGNEEYSREELVAEIGSACLTNECGIETPGTFRNSTAYIGGWLKALKDDRRLIVTAAGKAEKAVKMILGCST